jgi:hypothetical protein
MTKVCSSFGSFEFPDDDDNDGERHEDGSDDDTDGELSFLILIRPRSVLALVPSSAY